MNLFPEHGPDIPTAFSEHSSSSVSELLYFFLFFFFFFFFFPGTLFFQNHANTPTSLVSSATISWCFVGGVPIFAGELPSVTKADSRRAGGGGIFFFTGTCSAGGLALTAACCSCCSAACCCCCCGCCSAGSLPLAAVLFIT